jgi:hypothetical protein
VEQIGTIYFQENSRANKTEERDENKNVSPALESDLKEMCKKDHFSLAVKLTPLNGHFRYCLFDSIVLILCLFVVVVVAS